MRDTKIVSFYSSITSMEILCEWDQFLIPFPYGCQDSFISHVECAWPRSSFNVCRYSSSDSFATGDSKTCNGVAGWIIRVWASITHTAYSMREVEKYGNVYDYHDAESELLVVRVPNDNFVGSEYYCMRDSCKNAGQGYWSGCVRMETLVLVIPRKGRLCVVHSFMCMRVLY